MATTDMKPFLFVTHNATRKWYPGSRMVSEQRGGVKDRKRNALVGHNLLVQASNDGLYVLSHRLGAQSSYHFLHIAIVFIGEVPALLFG